ncbi:hypothetical protein J2W46_006607 [Paraburkholderia strydomiana]|nr:hypothetical protein [Paraburkholderia strydomiana]
MLNWDDEITAVTPSEARAFRKLGAAPAQGASVNKLLLVGKLSGDTVYRRILEAHLHRYLEKIAGRDGLPGSKAWTAWGRNSSLLRAAVLRRWLGELRGRALLGLRSTPAVSGESRTGSAKAIAKRLTPLGAPPHVA